MYRAEPEGVEVHFCLVMRPAEFGVMQILRTGPDRYARSLMEGCRFFRTKVPYKGSLAGERTLDWPEWGFVVEKGALWRASVCPHCGGSGCAMDGCRGYGTIRDPLHDAPIPTPTDDAFYAAVGLRYCDPLRRGASYGSD